LECNTDLVQLANWHIASFTTIPFVRWWSEWQEHLFCELVRIYYIALDEGYQGTDDEVCIENLSLANSCHLFLCLNNYFDRLKAALPQRSAKAASRLTMLHQPTKPISAMMRHLLLMLLRGKTQDHQHQETGS
jgi:hypothetical protein